MQFHRAKLYLICSINFFYMPHTQNTHTKEHIPQYIHDLKRELMAHTDNSISNLAELIVKNCAMKEDLKQFATKKDLENFPTRMEMKEGFSKCATKEDIKDLPKRSELALYTERTMKLWESMDARMTRVEKVVFDS